MTTYTSRKTSSTRYEWIVPAPQPWGAAAAEVGKAWEAARRAYWTAHDIAFGGPLPDDALRFHAADEEIVISFTIEEAA